MRKNHPEEEKLSLYIDGLLSGGELNLVERHLISCLDCQKEVEALKGIRSFIRETLKGDPDYSLNRSIWPLIEERLPKKKGLGDLILDWIRPVFAPRIVGSFTVAAILLLLFSFPYLYGIWKEKRPAEHDADILIEKVEVEGGPVMIFKTERKLTVIWLMEGDVHEES